MKKNFKSSKFLILSAFFLIFWDIWRIKSLFSTKTSALNIVLSIIVILLFLLLAYRAFHLYTDYIQIDDEKIFIAGLIKDKIFFKKDIKRIKLERNTLITITPKHGEVLSLRIRDLNKKDKDEIINLLIHYKDK